MNLLQPQALGTGRYQISGQEVTIPLKLAQGQRVGVRPERVGLNGQGQFGGTVELVTYMGAEQQVLVRVGSDTWTVLVPNQQVIARGDAVRLHVPDDAWIVV
jgi:putative spermidine/putrescine transport system ATP-binding protein